MSARTLIRRTSVAGASLLIAGGAAGAMAASASASTTQQRSQPPREAYGSVELGSPLQYEQFLALQGFGRYRGDVDYTNWTYAEPGSGVFAPVAGPDALVFSLGSSTYAHTLNGAGLNLVALSPTQLAFSGTGSYNGPGNITWTIRGQVNGSRLRATIAYNGSAYKVTLTGTVANDGSVSGTAKSSQGQALTFTMPAGSFVSVLHYIAPLKAAQVQRHDATFQFTIPAGSNLAGTKVTVKVHDGGYGARHDAYAAGVTGTTLTPYPIIGGPGITVRA